MLNFKQSSQEDELTELNNDTIKLFVITILIFSSSCFFTRMAFMIEKKRREGNFLLKRSMRVICTVAGRFLFDPLKALKGYGFCSILAQLFENEITHLILSGNEKTYFKYSSGSKIRRCLGKLLVTFCCVNTMYYQNRLKSSDKLTTFCFLVVEFMSKTMFKEVR